MHIPRGVMVALLTPMFSLYMISLTAAKRAGGGHNFKFEYVTVTLLQEVCKFVTACVCLEREAPLRDHIASLQIHRVALFGVPGLLYGFDNNFQYVILGFLQPTELAVLWNFKIFATVVLMHCFLGRRYTSWQWAAVLTLVLGCALTQVPHLPGWAVWPTPTLVNGHSAQHSVAVSSQASAAPATQVELGMPTKLVGVIFAVVGSTVAASSNVYCEWLVKQQPEESIHFQNMQLYFFGIVLNGATLVAKACLDPASPVHGPGGVFTGYDGWVWMIVLLGTASGLAISVALKFADNLAVIFSHVLTVLIVAAVSAEWFDVTLSASFISGSAFVLFGLIAFHAASRSGKEASLRPATDEATESTSFATHSHAKHVPKTACGTRNLALTGGFGLSGRGVVVKQGCKAPPCETPLYCFT